MAQQRRFDIIISAFTRGVNDIRNMGNQFGSLKKQALALATPLIGIGTAMLKVAKDMDDANARIKSGTEATMGQMEKMNRVAKRVWEAGAAESITAGADEVIKAFQKAGDVSEEELFRIAKNNADLAKRFNQDTDKATSAAAAMVKNLGVTWDQAYDILAKGMKSGVNIAADDLLESFSEYSTQFKDIGFNAAEMYSIIISGANEGVMGTDKVVDSLKEMKNKLSEMPDDVKAALDTLGISSVEMQAKLESGSLSLADAYKQILVGLQGMEAGTKRNAVGAALLGSQFEDMGTAAALGVDLAKVSMEDFAGSMESVGAQYDTMTAKGQLVWRGFLSALSEVVEYLNTYINIIIKSDKTTQFLVGTVAALTAATLAWNLGMKTAVGLIINVIAGLNAQIVAARAAAGSFSALTVAGKALLVTMGALVVAFAAIAVGKAISEFIKMREAMKQAEESQNNLIENSQRLRKEMEEFKDFEMPSDITGKTQEELQELQQSILKARLYWVTMRNELEKKSEEKTILGRSTEEAQAAQKELEKVNKRISGLTEQLKKTGDSANEITKVKEATKLSAKEMETFEKAAKKAYEEATKEAAKYAKQVIDFEEKIKYARLSTEDKLRELGRKGLDEEKIWADKKLQAEEKLAAAKLALREQDYKQAEKLAKDAESLYADLAVEITKDDAVVKTIEQTKKVAIAGVKETGSFIESVYTEQRDNAQKMQDDYTESAKNIKAGLDKLAEARTAKIAPEVDDASLKKAQDEINELTKEEIKIIKVKTVETKSTGGKAGASFASGGKFPGYDFLDKIPVWASGGEWFINPFSSRLVDRILPGLMAGINAARNPGDIFRLLSNFTGGIRKFSTGGYNMPMPRVQIPQRLATGGQAQLLPAGFANVQNVGSLNVTVGSQAGPVYGDRDLLTAVMRELGKQKKLGLQGAR